MPDDDLTSTIQKGIPDETLMELPEVNIEDLRDEQCKGRPNPEGRKSE